jgi:hypothetical protein
MGNFLLKIGRRPGVPMHLDLTQTELNAGVHDTNKRWTTSGSAPRTSGVPKVLRLPEPAGPLRVDLDAAARGAAAMDATAVVDLASPDLSTAPAQRPATS